MKRTYKISIISLVLAALCIGVVVFQALAATGVPKILSYQGRLLDASGNLLGGGGASYCFRFSLYNASSGGSQVWPAATASIMTAAVANGVFNIGVGDTSAGGDALTYNFQDSDTIYLNVQVATKVDALCTGGSEVFETLNPRTRVVASGYAINSDRLDGFNAGANASGTMIPVVASDTLTLAGVNPQINAAGTNTLTLQGGAGTGAIQFFSSNNYLTSTTFRMAGMVSANALQMTATPTQAVNFSLAALGPAIQLGAASGTYIGINTSGTFNGDYLEFENNSSTVFNVASSGQLTIGTSTNVAGALLNIATSTNIFTVLTNGNVGIGTTIPGGQLAVAANGVPTADQVTISNLGFPINTSGTNNLQLTYVGGNTGAIESGGERISITPGSGAQSTWNGLRIVAATTTVNTVTMNGLKFDSLGAGGAGLERAIFVDTGWDTAFAAAGVPGQRASSSLIRLGQLLAGGNVLGTFLSVNQTTSTGADFLNFQLASSSIFKVASSGAVVIGTSTPVGQLAVVAPAVPTADQVTISNLGFPINTSGTNNLQLTYVGGNATSIESGAQRISFTPGSGAGSTWNALRVVAATTTLNTVTMNGLKFDSVGAGGVGLERAVFVDTGWDTAFAAAGVPGQRATSSLVRLGQFLSGGNVAGTYLSINEATSTGADFMNFQLASSSIFKVASSGAVIIGTSTPFSATTTALTVCPLRTSTSTCTFSVTATTGTVMWVGSTNNATTGVSIIAKGKVLTATNDFGEYINVVGSDTDYGVGDLLSIASSGSNLFQKSATPYDPQIAGAITDSAGFIGGSDNGNGSNVIALAGRIPVKVTGVNGPIAIGDYITSSNIPGYGMRATQPGRVVGVAMQVFNGTDANTTGTVMIFVNPGWAPGSLTSASSSTSANLSIDSPLQQFFGIVASVGNTVQSFIRASIIAVENLFVKNATILPGGSLKVPSGPDQISGSATLVAGSTEVFIPDQQISSSSKIFVTPTTLTNAPLSVVDRQDGVGFTVGIAGAQASGVSFDWLVIQSYHVGGADQFWSQGSPVVSPTGAQPIAPAEPSSTNSDISSSDPTSTVATTTPPVTATSSPPAADASPPASATSSDGEATSTTQ